MVLFYKTLTRHIFHFQLFIKKYLHDHHIANRPTPFPFHGCHTAFLSDTPLSCRLFDAIVSHCVNGIINDKIELPRMKLTTLNSQFSYLLKRHQNQVIWSISYVNFQRIDGSKYGNYKSFQGGRELLHQLPPYSTVGSYMKRCHRVASITSFSKVLSYASFKARSSRYEFSKFYCFR